MYKQTLFTKAKEAFAAVLPIMAIVLALSFTIVPMPSSVLLTFLFGGAAVIGGMMLFSLGAELSMDPMGHSLGSGITKTKKLWLILLLSFVLGFMITVSEPDLQVLADQVQSIPNLVLIGSVSVGVGLFLVAAILRMLFGVALKYILILSYILVFVLSIFAPKEFLSVAFDAGGVTTGPMTVPFIMAFGVGICAIRNDRHALSDSFGLVALCSVGPILAVLILSLIYSPENAAYSPALIPDISVSLELRSLFTQAVPKYIKEIALAMLPIALFFLLFQLISLKQERRAVRRIAVGLLYTYSGLVLFLTGANVGFMPAGSFLGQALAALDYRWIIIPIGMLMGFFIVKAEPAVYVLMKQVEELTDGDITGKALQTSLCAGVSVSIGLALLRVLTGVSVLWFVLPGYTAAILLSFFVPKIFTAIAFDSGGVASGPMTAAFLLPFAVGACLSAGGNIITDAFGVVAMVAMTPLITIQLLGLLYRSKRRHVSKETNGLQGLEAYGELDIIEL